MKPIPHIDERRWRTLTAAELTAEEAEHLFACPACEARWQLVTTPNWVAALEPVAPPAQLQAATLARFDRHHRARGGALLLFCALAHGSAALAALLLTAEASFVIARLSVVLAHAITLLAVATRLAMRFPFATAVHVTALCLCAVLLAFSLTQTAAPRRTALK